MLKTKRLYQNVSKLVRFERSILKDKILAQNPDLKVFLCS